MFGLTTLGAIHTAISLVAIVAGIWAFVLFLAGLAIQMRWLRVSLRP